MSEPTNDVPMAAAPLNMNDPDDLKKIVDLYPTMMEKFGSANVKFYYRGCFSVATVLDRDNNTYRAGFAFCRTTDTMNKKVGRAAALYRIFSNDPKLSIQVPFCGSGYVSMQYCWWMCNKNFPDRVRGYDVDDCGIYRL